jgi:hypothetical protein
MTKTNPQELAQMNRDSFVRGKYEETVKVLFKSGLKVGEIAQIIKTLNDQLNGFSVGEPEKEIKDVKDTKKKAI